MHNWRKALSGGVSDTQNVSNLSPRRKLFLAVASGVKVH